ncbi:hypothetical protein ACGFY9_13025 [Streptomyces sp. NPDC048504]|uniref:hypothetical protein n=1 Tax=Streptomyces sp. NPDC048504 TaxID=3365559 RepID=UPI0037114670
MRLQGRTGQSPCSILTRGVESRVPPTAQRYGMGVLTFGPLNSGGLSGRSDPTAGHRSAGAGAKMFDLSRPGVRAKADAARELAAPAAEAGLPLPIWRPPSCGPIRRSPRYSSARAAPTS